MQVTVAERAGVSQTTVSAAELGKLNLRWSVMHALAAAVGYRLRLVFGRAVYADAQQALLRFGADLREARDLAGRTQEQIAERASLSQRTVSSAELGDRNLRWSVMHALARACDRHLGLALDPAVRTQNSA